MANLFSVVDLPEEGLPTRPINGSRPILEVDVSDDLDLVDCYIKCVIFDSVDGQKVVKCDVVGDGGAALGYFA
jgi:hypothetical protein